MQKTAPAPNRILREIVDIHYFGEGVGFAERRRMEDLCAGPLTRAVEGLLDSWGVPDDYLVSIDQLYVDLTGIHGSNLESELIPQIVSVIRTELETKIGPAGAVKPNLLRPVSRSIFSEILFFFERGFLPWSSGGDSQWWAVAAEVLSNLDVEDFGVLAAKLKSADARQRIARHFPEATLKAILPRLLSDSESRLIRADIELLLQQLPQSLQLVQIRERCVRILLDAANPVERVDVAEVCQMLVREFLRHQPTAEIFDIFKSPQLRRAFAENYKASAETFQGKAIERVGKGEQSPGIGKPTPRAVHSVKKKKINVLHADDNESIYIRNAGLVILAAYLPAYFQRLGVADEKQVLNVPAALALQHYLVFGSEDCAEWDLVLNKILCGVPLEESVETPPPLTMEQKAEAERLLNAVIGNWPALGNTSPNSLRTTFLQRDGVLRQKGADWHLHLTRTGFDVLMDRLPWTISMIRLPWMSWMLYTDWAGA